MRLIIDIPEEDYEFTKGAKTARYFSSEYYVNLILNGTPLDDVKAEIAEHHDIHLGQLKSRSNAGILMFGGDAYDRGIKHAIEILDNIGRK